jgi:hypothetical protein
MSGTAAYWVKAQETAAELSIFTRVDAHEVIIALLMGVRLRRQLALPSKKLPHTLPCRRYLMSGEL